MSRVRASGTRISVHFFAARQAEAMAKTKRSLREVVAKAEKANAGYKAVSVAAEIENGAAEADVALLKGTGSKKVDTREWMFAPWYGPRPDDRSFLPEDAKRPDRIAATQADEQGPHETPIRAGEERVLSWEPKLGNRRYTVEAVLTYDLNRYNERSFKDDQREIGRSKPAVEIKAGR